MSYVCYTLLSADRRCTYVGITNCMERRLRQHNGELAGGAKSTTRCTRRQPWVVACTVTGFRTKIEALQFEWCLHNMRHITTRGLTGRCHKLVHACNKVRWTSRAPLACDVPLTIHVQTDDMNMSLLTPLPDYVTVVKK